jgi:hypothetical protein
MPASTPRRENAILLAAGLLAGLLVWKRAENARKNSLFHALRRPGTAAITGASSGIGAEFARQLARRGYDLLLIARRAERLSALADELTRRHPIRAEVLAADLTDPAQLETVARRLEAIEDLALLVNNAGFGTRGKFHKIEFARQKQMLDLHAGATMRLTRAALPGMVARQRGGVINVSSLSAFYPAPGNASYTASKAFLNNFSQSLQMDLANGGVYIQALCPGFTYSEFHDSGEYHNFKRADLPGFLWMTAESVVSESLRSLGTGVVICVPGSLYKLAVLFARTGLVNPLVGLVVPRWRG